MDFEKAAMQAAKDIFGQLADIHCCYFHLTQSWRRNFNEKVLDVRRISTITHIRQNDDGEHEVDCKLRFILGKLCCIAYLPADKISETFLNWIRENPTVRFEVTQHPALNDYLYEYILPTYIQDDAKYPIRYWCVYEKGMKTRTNNFAEASNSRSDSYLCKLK